MARAISRTAARVAHDLVAGLVARPLDASLVLNVNVPDVPLEQLRGLKVTRLGHRHRSAPTIPAKDPKGNTVYWVGPPGSGADAGEGTDFHAVREGWAAVTPLTVDMTRHAALAEVHDWLQRLAPR
jgi:5'-nucleotidase